MRRPFILILMIICLAACRLANPEETMLLTEVVPAAEETQIAAAPIMTRTPFISSAVQQPTAAPIELEIVTSRQTTSSSANTVAVQNAVPACQPRTDWYEYTIVSGDTLYQLASRASTTVDAVVAGNCLADASVINVNQVILLPVLLIPGDPVEAVPSGQQTSNSTAACTMTLYAIGARLEAYNGPDRFNSTIMDTMTTLFPGTQMTVLSTSEYRIEVMMPDGRRGWIERYMGRLDGDCASVLTVSVIPPVPGDGCYMRIDTQAASTLLDLLEQPGSGGVVATFPNATWVEAITFSHADAYEFQLPTGYTGWIMSTERIHMRRGNCDNLPVLGATTQEGLCVVQLYGIGAPHIVYNQAVRQNSVVIAEELTTVTVLFATKLSEYRIEVVLPDNRVGWIEKGIGRLQGGFCETLETIQTINPPPETGCHIRIDAAEVAADTQLFADGIGVGAVVGTVPNATWILVTARGDDASGHREARQVQLPNGQKGWLSGLSVFEYFGMVSGDCGNLPVVGLPPGG